jgi:translation initiation factor IF-3
MIRCTSADGAMIGVIPTSEALRLAGQQGLDLVEISPNADPPVCRIMDYGKFKYEQSRKEREARKHQHSTELKEIKFHANVGEHDYQTKVNHIREFLTDGLKVKVSLYFRGRENAHKELGFEVINRVLKDCTDLCTVDVAPKLIGSSLAAIIGGKSKS